MLDPVTNVLINFVTGSNWRGDAFIFELLVFRVIGFKRNRFRDPTLLAVFLAVCWGNSFVIIALILKDLWEKTDNLPVMLRFMIEIAPPARIGLYNRAQ